jgi:purine-binding chemotaxis protein CheW
MDGRLIAPLGASAPPLEFVTLMLGEQLCGLPVTAVLDVLEELPMTPIPLAPAEIAGCMNLRGRIVIAIDLRRRLKTPAAQAAARRMAAVAAHGGERYAFLVDRVMEVVRLEPTAFEPIPPALLSVWAAFSSGVCRLQQRLMIALDVERLLAIGENEPR